MSTGRMLEEEIDNGTRLYEQLTAAWERVESMKALLLEANNVLYERNVVQFAFRRAQLNPRIEAELAKPILKEKT